MSNKVPTTTTSASTSSAGSRRGFFKDRLFDSVKNVADKTKALSQTSTRKAQCLLWEREMKTRKQEFGVQVYDVMERNRNIGEKCGGEKEPAVAEAFQNVVEDIAQLLERRKDKHSALIKNNRPKALCYSHQSAGETPREGSRSSLGSTASKQNVMSDDSSKSVMSDDSSTSNTSSRAGLFKQSMQQGLWRARSSAQAAQNGSSSATNDRGSPRRRSL